MAFEIIKQLTKGFFATIGDNETTIVSTVPDPPKLRLAVDADKVESNLGALSFNTRRVDGSETQDERGLVMGRLTANTLGGAVYIAVSPSQHAAVREVFYIDNGAAIFRVPVQAPNLRGDALVSSNGKFATLQQNDGNLVTYRRNPDGSLGAFVWASGYVEP